ncbi:NAD(P)H-dependent oxidoreductase [Neotamlana laminarinivorans]|uniref:NAD(P)H-dependent oxidoreductase n=1 Tax=Neotamlana laminarinivorans TaxID=2883124 RepID=A0A9X1I459_9FLAO|nr:NAD(P)H-dependent oxidoreductase [Tamlana laminarinivorans]MCB4800092.1 NAD(P)H-dependent oxidoreductase [Tamlana laminarinivorans]
MDIIKQLNWRYATKKFDATKKITDQQLDTLKQAFNLTATSYGLQTIAMVVVENKTKREQLVPHSYNQNQVLDASHLLVICIQEHVDATDVKKYYSNIKQIRNTPDHILKPYQEGLIAMLDKKTQAECQQWSKNQAYIALGNLMTVCANIQVDACPMEGFVPEKYDDILGLTKLGLKSVLLLPVGIRAEDDLFATLKKVRKPITETVIEI